jgi:hypothetical protein
MHDIFGVGLDEIGRIEEPQFEGFVLPLGGVRGRGLRCAGETENCGKEESDNGRSF